MEGVTGLVQQSADIATDAARVHEDEWSLAVREGGAESAWALALAASRSSRFSVAHDPEVIAEDRIDLGEDGLRLGIPLLDGFVWP